MDELENDVMGNPPPEVEALFDVETEQPAEPEPAQEATETPAEPPAEPEGETETPPEQPAEKPEAEQPTETPQEAEAKKWAGKYKSPEDLEAAYANMNAEATRMSQELRNVRMSVEERDRKIAEYAEFVEKAKPIIDQMTAQQPPVMDPDDPNFNMQAVIDYQVSQRVEKELAERMGQVDKTFEQRQSQLTQEQETNRARTEFQAFLRDNQDVANPDGIAALDSVFKTLQSVHDPSTGQVVRKPEEFSYTTQNFHIAKQFVSEPRLFNTARNLGFIPSDDEDMQLIRDATDNQALYEVLRAIPDYLATPEGHIVARRQAGLPEVVSQAQAQASQAQQQAQTAERNAAFVETDTPGAPAPTAPGQRPNDVLSEIGVDLWEKERSILG